MKGLRFENIKGNNNIKKATLGIGSAVVLSGVIAGGILYNHNKQIHASKINSELVFVRKETNSMNSQKNDQKRINDLSKLEKDFKEYSKEKEQNKKVSDYYATSISSGRQYFTDRTSHRIKNNTLTKDQLKKINQKDLQSKVYALNNEKSFMKQNKGVVYLSDNVKIFNKNINALLKQYNKKLNAMKKKADKESSEAASSSAAASSSSAAAQSSSIASAQSTQTQSSANNSNSGNSTSSTGSTSSYSGSTGNSTGSGSQTTSKTYTPSSNTTSTHTNNGYYSTKSYSATRSYVAPKTSTNSNTRTETDFAGTNSSNQHYVGKSTEGSHSINVTTNTGETGGANFN